MARVRQQYPQNYGTSANISTEFENVIRYLNAAEKGDKTIGELLAVLFDENGEFDGPVELRRNSDAIQYRVGEYANEDEGWISIATLDELRGRPGLDVGEVGTPIITDRADYTATAAQTGFNYAFAETDDLLVYKNGLLQTPTSDYTKNATTDTVTFIAPMAGGEKITIWRIRASLISGYRRQDYVTVSTQQVFGFEHGEQDKVLVFLNGILQREGGLFDYTQQPLNSTITMNTPLAPGNKLSIIYSENAAARTLSGLMLTEDFCDTATGLIRYNTLQIADGQVPQAKISGLVSALSTTAKLTVSGTTPLTPATGDLWLDTSQTPNQLKFYTGAAWLRTAPESSLPSFTTADAGRFVKVNGTGTGYVYADIDLSSVIAVTQRGAANGVASLDGSGRLPASQLPVILSNESLYRQVQTPSNINYTIKRIYRQKVKIDGIVLTTDSGTCDVQIAVDGVVVGTVYAANSVGNTIVIGTPIEVDASVAAKDIGFTVTNNAASANLEVTLSMSLLSS